MEPLSAWQRTTLAESVTTAILARMTDDGGIPWVVIPSHFDFWMGLLMAHMVATQPDWTHEDCVEYVEVTDSLIMRSSIAGNRETVYRLMTGR